MKQLKFNPQNTCKTLEHHASKCLGWLSWIGNSPAGCRGSALTDDTERLAGEFQPAPPAPVAAAAAGGPDPHKIFHPKHHDGDDFLRGNCAISGGKRDDGERASSRIQDKPTDLRKIRLRKEVAELPAPLSREPRLERSSDLCCVPSLPLPSMVRGAARCSHELEFYTSSHCACSPITGLMSTSLSPYHQSPGLSSVNAEGRAETGITERE